MTIRYLRRATHRLTLNGPNYRKVNNSKLMKRMHSRPPKSPLFPILLLFASVISAVAQSTAFTYQGRLDDSGVAANGNYDLTFGLYAGSSGGGPVGTIQTNLDLQVSNGLFTVTLDFGNVFDGTPYWVELGVRTNGAVTGFTTLAPRQALLASPYAVHAASASTTTGQIEASQLPTNVALLNGSADFTGTVTAGGYHGDGSGLSNLTVTSTVTNLVVVTNAITNAVLRGNNGSDFSSLPLTRSNLGGIKAILGYATWQAGFSNNPPEFFGQIGVSQNGNSWPYVAQNLSDANHADPFLGQWCGSFRWPDIAQWGDPDTMATNGIGNDYKMIINGFPGQSSAGAAVNVLQLENEQTNAMSALTFSFSQRNNILPGRSVMQVGLGNGGVLPWQLSATSNAAVVVVEGGLPLNFVMSSHPGSATSPAWLTAYFDGATADFHYLANNGSNALWLRASDGSVHMDGSLAVAGTVTAAGFSGDGSGLSNITVAAEPTLYTNASGVNINFSGEYDSVHTFILTNSGASSNLRLPDPVTFDGAVRVVKYLGATPNGLNIANDTTGSFGDVGVQGLGESTPAFMQWSGRTLTFQAVNGKWWCIGNSVP
jgi:hypothetical protein